MPPDFWALLAEPFPRASSTWRVAEVADDLQTARLARTLSRAVIASRLDAIVGAGNWSYQLAPVGERSLVCNLTVNGIGRAGVAAVAAGVTRVDVVALGDWALAAAAEQFGMSASAAGHGAGGDTGEGPVWVDFDAESGEALHPPADDDASRHAVPAAADGAYTTSEPAVQTGPGPVVTAADQRPAGHEVIERLLDRLREEGLGKEAARLVVAHGGYGRDQAETRELYGRLRALLLTASAVSSA